MTKVNKESIDHRFILSDLHIAEGTFRNKFYYGTENFTSDQEFAEFIETVSKEEGTKELILNGDFVDFIRITDIPDSKEDFDNWQQECQSLYPGLQLGENNIDCREKKYGLKTDDYKCIWKLYTAIKGHPLVFNSLTDWLSKNNNLRIIEGNHDPEWYWPKVQEYVRLKLKPDDSAGNPISRDSKFGKILFNNQKTEDDTILGYHYDPYPGIRIIHGHDTDPMTAFEEPRQLEDNETELTLPIGSFFNRYIINAVEFEYPFLDNVKPTGSIIQSIFKDNFFGFFVYIFSYIPYLLKMVLRFKLHYAKKLGGKLIFPGLPIAFAIYIFITYYKNNISLFNVIQNDFVVFLIGLIPFSAKGILNGLKSLFGMDKNSFEDKIFKYAAENNLHTIIVGHNHKPEFKQENNIKYLNSGSWTMTNEVNGKRVQTKPIFSFVHISDSETCAVKEWNPSQNRVQAFTSFSTSKMSSK